MATDFALIPCDICNNLFTVDEYMTHAQTHQQPTDYSAGNMYGPMPRPKGYVDPQPQSAVSTKDYTITTDGDINYNDGNMYGTKKETHDDVKNELNDEKENEIQEISQTDANSIRDIGCVIIKNGVRKDLIQNVLRLINNALSEGPQCLQRTEYTQNDDFLDLFNESAAFSLCQNVLGLTNVIIPKTAEIKLIFPNKTTMDEKEMENVYSIWDIDGLEHGQMAPYSLGMRIILSKQQFVFYKATHNEVFNRMKVDGMSAFIDGNKDGKNRIKWDLEKNELVKWDVDKGDIVLYHPFVCFPVNEVTETEDIDYYVTFRINHKNFNKEIGEKRAKHLWLGFEKLQNALINEVLHI